ncbi:RHOMBOID-like protein 4 [Hondaea fermentalgiana]|uniref:rhomboid protease n=1 Tax=Hondaea fermentalgiana TaxID=2315210 RepID=A0A2R5GUE1_9STRA|nr:RHOMBOID-like protein 4 [Hondaea fermentalgiana]|eukprot:GBG31991.1 RHOMBOID-like protein 4 [Hondaea fermentalgiana]
MASSAGVEQTRLATPVATPAVDTAETGVEGETLATPKTYRRLLRAASSYGSFQIQHADEPKSMFKTGRPLVCMTLFLCCSVMLVIEFAVNNWELESFSTNPTIGVSVSTLLELGAKRADLILEGDWYRLIAPIFLHAGILHYLFNMFALWQIGFPLENQFGSLAAALIILLGGFQGVVWSAILSPVTVGVGASGAIFALFGSAWSELILNWSLYKGQHCISITQLVLATAVNLMLGLMPFLDNFAHIAGFVTGILVGFGVLVSNRFTRWGELKERKRYQVVLQSLSVLITPLLVVVSLLVLYLGVDADEWCTWCRYLSCVPFPPGDSPWWTCDECSDAGVTAYFVNSTTVTVYCPSSPAVNATAPDGLADNNNLLIGLCQEVC